MVKGIRTVILVSLGIGGCSSGEASHLEEVPPNLRLITRVVPPAPDHYPFTDVSRVKVGQWARYQEGDRTWSLAAVSQEGADVWIEVVEEGEPREASARLVSPGGAVKKAFFREISKDGSGPVVPQALEQSTPIVPPAPEGARDVADETLVVGGHEIRTKRVRTRVEDLNGRIQEETCWWSPEVPPLYAVSPEGGLVRRVAPRGTLTLLGFGTDAKPSVLPAGD
jgi:hypothetical protein